MQKILLNTLFAVALLSLAGCYETASSTDSTVKTTKSKCGASKCGDSKKMKCGAGKCGSGKCGTAK